jgi:hypothetical protein
MLPQRRRDYAHRFQQLSRHLQETARIRYAQGCCRFRLDRSGVELVLRSHRRKTGFYLPDFPAIRHGNCRSDG